VAIVQCFKQHLGLMRRDSETPRYEIAEVVDPQVNVVAKVSKAVLATLK